MAHKDDVNYVDILETKFGRILRKHKEKPYLEAEEKP
jgi:hypothetical protein